MELPNKADLRVEEFITLRAELMAHLDATEKNIIACLTINAVALTYALKDGVKDLQPFVIIIACAITVYFWLKHIDHRNGIAKIAAYIKTFLEDKETNLRWESITRSEKLNYKGSKIAYWLVTFLLPYPVLVIISILTIFWTLIYKEPFFLPVWSMFLISTIVIGIVFVISMKTDKSFMKLLKPWNIAFEEFKDKELSSLFLKSSEETIKTNSLIEKNVSNKSMDVRAKQRLS